jgi:hypothetical protein
MPNPESVLIGHLRVLTIPDIEDDTWWRLRDNRLNRDAPPTRPDIEGVVQIRREAQAPASHRWVEPRLIVHSGTERLG